MAEILRKSVPISGEGVRYNEEGDLIIPVLGIPFGSIDDKDMTNEFFTEKTATGPLKEFLSYWDHKDDPDYMPPEIGFGDELIGKAIRTGQNEEGIFANIVIDRNTKYKRAIKYLAENGYLDASSVAEAGEKVKSTGEIIRWDWKNLDLTPTSASRRAIVQHNAPFKSFKELVNMAEEKKEDKKEDGAGEEKKETPALTLAEQVEKSVADVVDEKKVEEQEQKAVVEGDFQKSVLALLGELTSKVKELEKSLSTMSEEHKASFKTVIEKEDETHQALPALGKSIASHVFARNKDELKKSAAELDAEKILEDKIKSNTNQKSAPGYGKFAGAPGMSRGN